MDYKTQWKDYFEQDQPSLQVSWVNKSESCFSQFILAGFFKHSQPYESLILLT